jgi:hypothetical protein
MMTVALDLDGPANPELIRFDEPRELAYWADVLGCSQDKLQKIGGMVGPHAIDVRRHLALVRHAEGLRETRQSLAGAHRGWQAPRRDPAYGVITCCFAAITAIVITLGTLGYDDLLAPDPWASFLRERGCEAVANGDPTIKQLRCLAGRVNEEWERAVTNLQGEAKEQQ